jgi:hypothetical protein
MFTTLEDHNRLIEMMGDPTLVPEAESIIDGIADKIDRIYGFKGALENAAAALDAQMKRVKESRDAIESNLKRLDSILIWNMQNHAAEKIPGNDVRAQLQYTQVCEPISPTPQLADCALFPQYVRTKLEWDKTAIKNDHKAGRDIGAVAEVRKNAHVRWYPTAKVLEGAK